MYFMGKNIATILVFIRLFLAPSKVVIEMLEATLGNVSFSHY